MATKKTEEYSKLREVSRDVIVEAGRHRSIADAGFFKTQVQVSINNQSKFYIYVNLDSIDDDRIRFFKKDLYENRKNQKNNEIP